MALLKGRVALVTSAARGLGRAIALELACRGASVAVHYRISQAEAEEVAARIESMGVAAMVVQGDVAVPAEARAVVRRVLDEWGRLDVLVNHAGVTRDKSLRKMAGEEWADMINIDLNGTFYCTSAAIPGMVEQNFGRIVNIGSYLGRANSSGQANYAACMSGVIAFTKSIAMELAQYGVTANAVVPGFTQNGMLSQMPANLQEQVKAQIPMGRFGQPEDIARAVAFLAADGDYITGQQINVNGGLCA